MSNGQKLKKLRIENNLTIDELVKIFNKKYNAKAHKSIISKLENNKKNITINYLNYYADYFGVSYEWLQNDDDVKHIEENATIQSLGLNTRAIPLYGNDELVKSVHNILNFHTMVDDMKRYYINLPKIDNTNLFAFTVLDDIGLPLIPHGAIVVVDSSIAIDKLGDNVGAFVYVDKVYIGQYLKKHDDMALIVPTNTQYNNILIDNNYFFACIGQIVKIIKDFKK